MADFCPAGGVAIGFADADGVGVATGPLIRGVTLWEGPSSEEHPVKAAAVPAASIASSCRLSI
ncbi:hypothetical protein GCM10027262_44060 [Nocardia tengchongensis]